MRDARLFFLLLFAVLAATRLCHRDILWAEETLPLAAATQMLDAKALYRDLWFDKPPLLPAVYLLWAAHMGWMLRLAGALYGLLACALAWRFARDLWGRCEAFCAAGLMAFYLTFDLPSAVIPLAADLLMVAPHLAAVWLAWRGRAFWSGALAGVAFLVNPKGLFVLAACALWRPRSLPALALGFCVPNALAALWLWSQGALAAYYEQVWKWGRIYAAGTFVANPLWNGLVRTLHWLGFHVAAVLAAAWFWLRDRSAERWRCAAWAAISLAGVAAGWRFFPRYFFELLPAIVLPASRGFTLLSRKRSSWHGADARIPGAVFCSTGPRPAARLALGGKPALALASLLLAPLVRFGPRYGLLARDLLTGRPHQWADVAMDRDSRAAAQLARALARPGDTLFVWGFRPELYVYTRLPAANRFLDSQPLTGVPADRHLTQSQPVAAEFTRANRRELMRSRPSLILDGLGPFNPKLAISAYADLQPWLAQYQPVARTPLTVLYRLLPNPAGGPLAQER